MKRLLNVDEGWLAGIQNCPPQGNLGGGVDEVVEGSEGELQYFLLFQTCRCVVEGDRIPASCPWSSRFDLEAVARRWLVDLGGSGVELVSIRTASSS